MSEDAARTPLDGVQRELGGEFVVGLGWFWVTTFGDPEGEYRAVRTDVGLWATAASYVPLRTETSSRCSLPPLTASSLTVPMPRT